MNWHQFLWFMWAAIFTTCLDAAPRPRRRESTALRNASFSAGGPAGGGGGGVGGGLGGGGGASLGNDLQGEDKDKKAKEIDANKLAGNYNSVGGKGFSAVAGGKEDNPFKDLFDSKSSGGVEEDRSIASDDGGKDSGLFQRISSRMTQVVAEKRIEAGNLE